MFLKHNILFYNLDQNVFSVDMKTYFYKILKMILIYVLEMIFYTIILGNTVITVHTALVELLVSTRVIFLEICHTHKSRHTGMCILNWLDFLYWLLIIFFEALLGLHYMYMYLSLHDEAGQLRVLNTERVLFNCQDAWSIIYIFNPHLCKELSVTGTMYAHASSYHSIRVCIVNVLYTCMHTY